MHRASVRPNSLELCTLIVFLLVAGHLGCKKDPANPVVPGSVRMEGNIVTSTGCLSSQGVAAAPIDSLVRDCVDYEYDGVGVLMLHHRTAPFNCCPASFSAVVETRGDTLTIQESEVVVDGGCRCLCLYDIGIRVENLPPGIYLVRILETNLAEGELPIEFTADLSAATNGSRCQDRHTYPWMGD
jgi:hypothetical protein